MRRLAASLLCLAVTAAATAGPIDVASEPITRFERLSLATQFGPFTWRGGLTLTAGDETFGGWSGLAVGADCERLLAISDKGSWLEASLSYTDGALSGLSRAVLSPMLDSKGQRMKSKVLGDAEAMVMAPDGKVIVGFEGYLRFGSYDLPRSGPKAPFRAIPHPKDMDDGPPNAGIEALGLLADGRLLALGEGRFDAAGNVRGWAWKDWRTTLFAIERYGEYSVTDLAVLPDGTVLTLERRFSNTALPGMAIRRFRAADIAMNAVIRPELLMEATAPASIIDNMEGIATCRRDGETRVTLISDDNFNRSIQSTILLQFAYAP